MASLYRGHCFPVEVISHAVWLYHRFTLSLRDVEDLLAERGIIVSYEAIRFWCLLFGGESQDTRQQGRYFYPERSTSSRRVNIFPASASTRPLVDE